MFELEYHEIDRLMKIEHDMLFEGSHPGVTGGWDDRRHSVWKKGVYDIYRFSPRGSSDSTI